VQEPGRVDTGRSGHRVELLESVRGLKKITRWPPYSSPPRPLPGPMAHHSGGRHSSDSWLPGRCGSGPSGSGIPGCPPF
jgi:hypothetical protein